MVLACTDEISLSILENVVTNLLPEGDTALAWKHLKEKFKPTTGMEATKLMREFMINTLKKGQDT